MMNRLTRILFTFGVIVCLAACGDPPTAPEEELRAWVAAGEEAAEHKERRELVGMVAPSYADARGNDREQIDKTLRAYFFRQHEVGLVTRIEEITVYDDTAAKIVLTVGMAGTNDGVLGFSADAYRFDMEVEKASGEWKLISARWGQLGDELR
jgi:hypothetical protein